MGFSPLVPGGNFRIESDQQIRNWLWLSRPRQKTGMSVDDYIVQFTDWKEKMESHMFSADEESYIEYFIFGLEWDLCMRVRTSRLKPHNLSTAYSIARIEGAMMFIESVRGTGHMDTEAPQMFDEMPRAVSDDIMEDQQALDDFDKGDTYEISREDGQKDPEMHCDYSLDLMEDEARDMFDQMSTPISTAEIEEPHAPIDVDIEHYDDLDGEEGQFLSGDPKLICDSKMILEEVNIKNDGIYSLLEDGIYLVVRDAHYSLFESKYTNENEIMSISYGTISFEDKCLWKSFDNAETLGSHFLCSKVIISKENELVCEYQFGSTSLGGQIYGTYFVAQILFDDGFGFLFDLGGCVNLDRILDMTQLVDGVIDLKLIFFGNAPFCNVLARVVISPGATILMIPLIRFCTRILRVFLIHDVNVMFKREASIWASDLQGYATFIGIGFGVEKRNTLSKDPLKISSSSLHALSTLEESVDSSSESPLSNRLYVSCIRALVSIKNEGLFAYNFRRPLLRKFLVYKRKFCTQPLCKKITRLPNQRSFPTACLVQKCMSYIVAPTRCHFINGMETIPTVVLDPITTMTSSCLEFDSYPLSLTTCEQARVHTGERHPFEEKEKDYTSAESAFSTSRAASRKISINHTDVLDKLGGMIGGRITRSMVVTSALLLMAVEVVYIMSIHHVNSLSSEQLEQMRQLTEDVSVVGFGINWMRHRLKTAVDVTLCLYCNSNSKKSRIASAEAMFASCVQEIPIHHEFSLLQNWKFCIALVSTGLEESCSLYIFLQRVRLLKLIFLKFPGHEEISYVSKPPVFHSSVLQNLEIYNSCSLTYWRTIVQQNSQIFCLCKIIIPPSFSHDGACPVVKSVILHYCESLTTVEVVYSLLMNPSVGCHPMILLVLKCHSPKEILLYGYGHLERRSLGTVAFGSINLGLCLKLITLAIEAPKMASVDYQQFTSLEVFFCSLGY